MLAQLHVENLVLLESLTLELAPGFNVLTGETGAGKSMILDALGLVLGGRARPDVVRAGAKECEVAALFELGPEADAVRARLEAMGVPCDGELLVRRVVQLEGRSRAYLNGKLSTAAQLAELAGDLCDIASQHESVRLTDPATHLEYLDAFGRLEAPREALAARVGELTALVRRLAELREASARRAEREDFLAFSLREIDELEPREGEEAELESERARLKHADRLEHLTRGASFRLYEGEGAVCDALGRLAADVSEAAELDASLGPLAHAIEAARAELADSARALARYADGIESSPARLAEVEERWFRLQKLLRKHGPGTRELLAQRDRLAQELTDLGGSADLLDALDQKREALHAELAREARALSSARRGAAESLADAIGRELAALGMGRARVVVDVAPTPGGGDGAAAVDGARLTPSGIDRVEFLIAPNRGEEPRPLRRIASGGELSRSLLALKRVLAEKGPAGTYVFDEVDAGVSGGVAEVIGRAIADIARHRQVLCITHLPQIAALADVQFVVDKLERGERTESRVRRLGSAERVDEIARMIGGVRVGDAAKKAAKELLRAGRA